MIAPALPDAFVSAMMDTKSKREEILTQLDAARASFQFSSNANRALKRKIHDSP
jgi:hypothetical protein